MATIRNLFVNALPQKLHVTLKYSSNTGVGGWPMEQNAPYTFELIRTPKDVRIKIIPPTDINYAGWVGALMNIVTLGTVQAASGTIQQWVDSGVPLSGVGAIRTVPLPIPWGMGNDPKYFAKATFTLMAFSRYGALVRVDLHWDNAAADEDNTTLKYPNLPYTKYINSGEYIPPAINKPTSNINPINENQPTQPIQPVPSIQPVQPLPQQNPYQTNYGMDTRGGNPPEKKSNMNTYLLLGGVALAALFMIKR